jgi:hypothetical protein
MPYSTTAKMNSKNDFRGIMVKFGSLIGSKLNFNGVEEYLLSFETNT